MLKLLARRFGYNMYLVQGVAFSPGAVIKDISSCNHVWLEHDDHVYDITATQFDDSWLEGGTRIRKVHIVKIGNKNYVAANDMHRRWQFEEWPGEQSPMTFQKELSARAKKIALTFA